MPVKSVAFAGFVPEPVTVHVALAAPVLSPDRCM